MNHFDEAPQLNPWPFIVGDAALLATAYLIGMRASVPLDGTSLIAVVVCVALGAILAIIPFLVNHTRRQELALADRQREIAALAQSTATSTEQLSIATASLHGIAETAARNLKIAEHLPHKLQDKINEFKTQLNEVAVTENESLAQEINTLRTSETERLETALASIRKTASELAAIEAASRKNIGELKDSLARAASTAASIEKTVANALAALDAKLPGGFKAKSGRADESGGTPLKSTPPFVGEPTPAATPPATAVQPPPVARVESGEAPGFETSATHATALADAPVAEERVAARRRPPRKSTPAASELMLGIDTGEFSQVAPDDAAPAVSADGFTRLVVTAYIGIGNKLFVRGDGPGLSWERGVPLQFVSIGKWRWENADASAPVALKLYKNDEQECTALGTIELAPGHQREVTASFG